MPAFDEMDDEALTTWLVGALMEAQRRGLTTVMMAEPATAEALAAEAETEATAPTSSAVH
ncbi:hypothetical protein [Alsobacter sp. SYSU BS001988]